MVRLDNNRDRRRGYPLGAITFDVTHTLIHSPRLVEIYHTVLERHGIHTRPVDLRREIPWVWKEFECRDLGAAPLGHQDRFTAHPKGPRGWWQDFLVRLCQRLGVDTPTRFAGAELFDRFAHRDAWEVYDDVRPCLTELRDSNLRLGVISNWDDRLPGLLDELDLLDFFDTVVFSSGLGLEKPNPGIFDHCLRELGVPAHRALHVGDHAIHDIEGAHAAGMEALRIDRRGHHPNLGDLLGPLFRPDPPSETSIAQPKLCVDGGRRVRH